jgi:hypothetical protein
MLICFILTHGEPMGLLLKTRDRFGRCRFHPSQEERRGLLYGAELWYLILLVGCWQKEDHRRPVVVLDLLVYSVTMSDAHWKLLFRSLDNPS